MGIAILIYAALVVFFLFVTLVAEEDNPGLLFFIPLFGVLYEIDATDKTVGITIVVGFCVWLMLLYGGITIRNWKAYKETKGVPYYCNCPCHAGNPPCKGCFESECSYI